MKRNSSFVVKKIAGITYLLPVGQAIADMDMGISINPTGEYLWEQLESEVSLERLAENTRTHFGLNEEYKSRIFEDTERFVNVLRDRGMLRGTRRTVGCTCSRCKNNLSPINSCVYGSPDETGREITGSLNLHGTFSIGGLGLYMYGDDGYFSEDFDKFRAEAGFCESMRIEAVYTGLGKETEKAPEPEYYDTAQTFFLGEEPEDNVSKECRVLIHCSEMTILEYDTEYVLFFHKLSGIEELHLKKDGSFARFYLSELPSEDMRFSLFHAIRIAFLLFCLKQGLVMCHSVSVLFKGKAVLFSAPSGIGKSTHAGLWNKRYGTPFINGDLNLIGIKDNEPFVFGTPWCGTSNVFDETVHPLGAVILLKRGSTDRIEELSMDKKILYVQQRLVSPVWNEEMLDETFSAVGRFIEKIYVKRYFCGKEEDSVEIIHDDLEESGFF